MRLGDQVYITISTSDMSESIPYYEKLGFQTLNPNPAGPPWVQLTDGMILLLLGQDEVPFQGLTYLADDMVERVQALENMGIEFARQAEDPNLPFRAVFFDPNGCGISLIHYDPYLLHKPVGQSFSRCGKFGEFSIPTQDLTGSLTFWQKLGYECPSGIIEDPYPWAILTDGMMTIGLHQTERFKDPIITYYATDMASRIESLRARGLSFTWEEKGDREESRYALTQAPDGQGFFLFTGET